MYQTNAIVLISRSVGECDELVSFYTRDFGKLIVRAKGTKKTTTKQGNFLHSFGVVRISFILGKSGPILSGISSVKEYPRLSENLLPYGYVSSYLLLCDKLIYEYAKDEAMWKLLLGVLETAEQIARAGKNVSETLWRKEKLWLVSLMEVLGVRPRTLQMNRAANRKQLDRYLQRILENKFNTPLAFFGLRMSAAKER